MERRQIENAKCTTFWQSSNNKSCVIFQWLSIEKKNLINFRSKISSFFGHCILLDLIVKSTAFKLLKF